jgi:hypothetical protein
MEELKVNKATLIALLRPQGRYDIGLHWHKSEEAMVSHYTQMYANLGSAASQRGENHHPVIREITSCQLSFEDSGKRLATTVSSPLRILLHSNTIYRGPTIVTYRSALRHSSTWFARLAISR